MNGYPKEVFQFQVFNNAKKFLSEKLMTTNSCQIMNDEKTYTVIIPFIGNPSIIFKKSSTKNLKSINKKCCTIFNEFKVQNYFSLKDETPLALQANVVYLFEGSCGKNQTYIGKKYIWQLGLGSIFQEIQPFFNIYLPAMHLIILPLRIFTFCHMVTMILIIM